MGTKRQQPYWGPITREAYGPEWYATIFAFAESPIDSNVLWAGSDDGYVHVTRDGGKNWTKVTPPDLPEFALISIIEPSPHSAAEAYVAATRYKLQDNRPYLYKTSDYGKTWIKITSGIPEHDFTRVIREDPGRPGLLYAGTETGVYVSFDDGAHWQSMKLGLPVVPVHDLLVKDRRSGCGDAWPRILDPRPRIAPASTGCQFAERRRASVRPGNHRTFPPDRRRCRRIWERCLGHRREPAGRRKYSVLL